MTPPNWVRKRDGSLAPFDADKISRGLFAVTEALGRPDAFLARELTDGVLHFLGVESDHPTPSTQEIAELVIKVVRELGQPLLAETFATFDRAVKRKAVTATNAEPVTSAASDRLMLHLSANAAPDEVVAECLRQYTLRTVFARDIASAHGEGLLVLTGLEAPGELAGHVLAWPAAGIGLLDGLEQARRSAAQFVVLDGPEFCLTSDDEAAARALAHDLELGLRLTRLHSVVNLNVATPPSSADDLAEGPLFTMAPGTLGDRERGRRADRLLETLAPLAGPRGRIRLDWHLGSADLTRDDTADGRLLRAVRLALDGAAITFVYDRPRRGVVLAEGIERMHPAALLAVGLHLPRLLRQTGARDPELFLAKKLPSLVRLALSAGVQKRAFLRRHDRALSDGFLLDRARLLVVPVGLDRLVRELCGAGLCDGEGPLDLGRRIVGRLREVLRQDGLSAHLGTCLDGPATFHLHPDEREAISDEEAAGLTPWDSAAPARSQWLAGGALHAAAGGTMALFLPEDRPVSAEQVVGWLRAAWRQTEVVRLRLMRPVSTHRQMSIV
jgi:hypothetical protein